MILNICSTGRALEQTSLRSEVNTFVGKSQELLRALRRGFDEFSRAASLDAERQRFCTRRPTKTDVVTWRLNPGALQAPSRGFFLRSLRSFAAIPIRS